MIPGYIKAAFTPVQAEYIETVIVYIFYDIVQEYAQEILTISI